MPRPEAVRIVRRRPSTAWIRSCVRYVNQRASRARPVGPLGGPVVGRRRARRHHDDQRPDAVPQDQEIQARGDVERVDERGARIARRPVQEIGDREAHARAASGRRPAGRRVRAPPVRRAKGCGRSAWRSAPAGRAAPSQRAVRSRGRARSRARSARTRPSPSAVTATASTVTASRCARGAQGPADGTVAIPRASPGRCLARLWTIDRTDRPSASSDRMMPVRPAKPSTIGPCPGSA